MESMAYLKWWLDYSKPGDEIIYHKGDNLYIYNESTGLVEKREMARAMLQLYNQGAVTLTQRKISDEPAVFEYIAKRR
jgi:hypothetical protein